MPEKILYQFLPVSPTLELRINGNVLYLKNIFCFAGDDTGCSDTAVLGQHEHFTAFQIMVYHGFLFIGQKQQVEVLFLIMSTGCILIISLLFERVCMAKIILMGIEPNKTPGNIVDFQHGID